MDTDISKEEGELSDDDENLEVNNVRSTNKDTKIIDKNSCSKSNQNFSSQKFQQNEPIAKPRYKRSQIKHEKLDQNSRNENHAGTRSSSSRPPPTRRPPTRDNQRPRPTRWSRPDKERRNYQSNIPRRYEGRYRNESQKRERDKNYTRDRKANPQGSSESTDSYDDLLSRYQQIQLQIESIKQEEELARKNSSETSNETALNIENNNREESEEPTPATTDEVETTAKEPESNNVEDNDGVINKVEGLKIEDVTSNVEADAVDEDEEDADVEEEEEGEVVSSEHQDSPYVEDEDENESVDTKDKKVDDDIEDDMDLLALRAAALASAAHRNKNKEEQENRKPTTKSSPKASSQKQLSPRRPSHRRRFRAKNKQRTSESDRNQDRSHRESPRNRGEEQRQVDNKREEQLHKRLEELERARKDEMEWQRREAQKILTIDDPDEQYRRFMQMVQRSAGISQSNKDTKPSTDADQVKKTPSDGQLRDNYEEVEMEIDSDDQDVVPSGGDLGSPSDVMQFFDNTFYQLAMGPGPSPMMYVPTVPHMPPQPPLGPVYNMQPMMIENPPLPPPLPPSESPSPPPLPPVDSPSPPPLPPGSPNEPYTTGSPQVQKVQEYEPEFPDMDPALLVPTPTSKSLTIPGLGFELSVSSTFIPGYSPRNDSSEPDTSEVIYTPGEDKHVEEYEPDTDNPTVNAGVVYQPTPTEPTGVHQDRSGSSDKEGSIRAGAGVKMVTPDEEDEDADALRASLLQSLKNKRNKKLTQMEVKATSSGTVSPQSAISRSSSPLVSSTSSIVAANRRAERAERNMQDHIIPQHEPVVINLDDDSSDDEKPKSSQQQAFLSNLGAFLKDMRQSVDNKQTPVTPKPQPKARQKIEQAKIHPTPDAMRAMSMTMQDEYRKLREQIMKRMAAKAMEGKENTVQVGLDIKKPPGNKVTKSVSPGPKKTTEQVERESRVKAIEAKIFKLREEASQAKASQINLQNQMSRQQELLTSAEKNVNKLREQLAAAEKIYNVRKDQMEKLVERANASQNTTKERTETLQKLDMKLLDAGRKAYGDDFKPKLAMPSKRPIKTQSMQSIKKPKMDSVSLTVHRKTQAELAVEKRKLLALEKQLAERLRKLKQSENTKLKPPKRPTVTSPGAKIMAIKEKRRRLSSHCEKNKTNAPEHVMLEGDKITLENLNITDINNVNDTTSRRRSFIEVNPSSKPNLNSDTAYMRINKMEGEQQKLFDPKGNITPRENNNMARNNNQPDVEKTKDTDQMNVNVDQSQATLNEGPMLNKSKTLKNVLNIKLPTGKKLETVKKLYQESASLSPQTQTPSNKYMYDLCSMFYPEKQDLELRLGKQKGGLGTQEKGHIGPLSTYKSPLLNFKSYRFSVYFRTKEKCSISSSRYSHGIEPHIRLCRFDLNGSCNDDTCPWQHARDYTYNTEQVLKDIVAYCPSVARITDATDTQQYDEKIDEYVKGYLKQNSKTMTPDEMCLLMVSKVNDKSGHVHPHRTFPEARSWRLPQRQRKQDTFKPKTPADFTTSSQAIPMDLDDILNDQDVRYFVTDDSSVQDLEAAVLEMPLNVTLWLKLAYKKLSDSNSQNNSLEQALNVLSRGLEANKTNTLLWQHYLKLFGERQNTSDLLDMYELGVRYAPSYEIWWNFLQSASTYKEKDAVCQRLFDFLLRHSNAAGVTLATKPNSETSISDQLAREKTKSDKIQNENIKSEMKVSTMDVAQTSEEDTPAIKGTTPPTEGTILPTEGTTQATEGTTQKAEGINHTTKSHQILETVLYWVQLHVQCSHFETAVEILTTFLKDKPNAKGTDKVFLKSSDSTRAHDVLLGSDLCFLWLCYTHLLEFHCLPVKQLYCGDSPDRIRSKDPFMLPWQPRIKPKTTEKEFAEALADCAKTKAEPVARIKTSLPLYRNLISLLLNRNKQANCKKVVRKLLNIVATEAAKCRKDESLNDVSLETSMEIPDLWLCLISLQTQPAATRKVIREAIEALPTCPAIYNTAANFELLQGEPDDALEHLENSVIALYDTKGENAVKSPDPNYLFCKLLGLGGVPITYNCPPLQPHITPSYVEDNILYLWLNYCSLLVLQGDIQHAIESYEGAIYSLKSYKDAQGMWWGYLSWQRSRLTKCLENEPNLKQFHSLVNRCLMTTTTKFSFQSNPSLTYIDYSFHYRVVEMYVECIAVEDKFEAYQGFLTSMPNNLQLITRMCEFSLEHTQHAFMARRTLETALYDRPPLVKLWKFAIAFVMGESSNTDKVLQIRKLYQRAVQTLPLESSLWKHFVLFEISNGTEESANYVITKCQEIGLDIDEYLKAILGSDKS
ncbi:unnamed protein product [Owenia fusiformis]|uniref:Putative zinc-finger domain-containing protein n=1 Tax=Owenia fusiformis TaxID=6347 RepID=A0A8S4PZJ8_OWEFU|nr:unnamed protein product [Owenia fusiformis]